MKTTKLLLLPGLLAALCMLGSCAETDIEGGDRGGDRGAAVTFTVSETQDAAAQAAARSAVGGTLTRAAFADNLALLALTPGDLTAQKLPAEGGDGNTCLIETTVAGVNPVQGGAQTRADITTTATLGDFSSMGYSGAAATSISGTPDWFHNEKTKKTGELYNVRYWSWSGNRFARFYGVYPFVEASYTKVRLSDATYAGTPYVDFEAEQDVKKQKDLMTACSGVVHYATRNVAPTTNLAFRHALTAVRFKVGQNLSWNKTINKVEIIGAKSKGRYTLATDENGAGAAWSGLNTPATFTLGGDGTVSVSTSQAVNQIIMGNTGDNYTFYMIPQSLSGVSVKIHFSDGSTPITASLSGTWKPGTTKTYALSQNTSTWAYQLAVTSPAAVAYTATTTGNYTVQSYRKDPATGTQQAVPWKVVGYDADGDGNFSMDEKPDWLTSLSKTEGNGGTAAETGTATLQAATLIDKLAERNNALKSATPLGSAGSPYDLSTKGGTTARSTANSYVISAPGHYSIPLVYGNAITGGNNNPSSYQSSKTGTYILRNFKDHNNQNITDPWIEKTNGGANSGIDGAKIVWADEANLVHLASTPVVRDGSGDAYLEFEVRQADIRNGNAVIAVTKNNVVVWSWHLWFAPQNVLNTTPVTNFQNHTYNFTNETLGWKYTSWNGTTYSSPRSVQVKVEQTYGQAGGKQIGYITITQNNGNVRQGYPTFYQFGRKDAFPGTDALAQGSFTPNGSNNISIPNGIQNPGTFYTWGSSWNTGYNQYNLWSMENTTTGWNDNAVIKTIYDPSPAGFKMPASNAFTGFTTNGQNNGPMNVSGAWENGWNFNNKISSPDATVYFPASGYRYAYNSDGLLYYVGHNGYFWSAVPGHTSNGCYLTFTRWNVRPQVNDTRSYGWSVRPVSE